MAHLLGWMMNNKGDSLCPVVERNQCQNQDQEYRY